MYRSEKYKAFVRSHPCLICGSYDTIAHHESLGLGMMGGKCPDSHCVPLCTKCHFDYHNTGPPFWDKHSIDIKMVILKLLTEYLEMLNVYGY